MASPGSDWPGILLATVGGQQGWPLVLGLPKGREEELALLPRKPKGRGSLWPVALGSQLSVLRQQEADSADPERL